MATLAATIVKARGWPRRLVAFACGGCGALAMAPFNLLPFMAVMMTAAVWLIDGTLEPQRAPAAPTNWSAALRPAGRALAIGWWWGFGYFAAGLWWLGAAFLADAGEFAWALPLGVLGLPAVLAIFPACGFFCARLVWTRGPARILSFSAALFLSEWLRGHLFTGFPWNPFGMALGGHLVPAQLASLVGLYGLTLATLLIFAAPATLFDSRGRASFTATSLAAAALAAIYAFGAWRLSQPAPAPVPGVAIRIMQPNLAQDDKFAPEFRDEILGRYLALSQLDDGVAANDATIVIWPESAFPFILSRDAIALATIGAALPQGAVLVTGAARVEEDRSKAAADESEAGEAPARIHHPVFFNALQVVGPEGRITGSYDKVHLVPFGEYLPFEAALTGVGLRQFVHVPGGFSPGPMRRALAVPGLPPVAPLICYEAIFPGEVMPQDGGPRPGVLLNVTDDGWFGETAGPFQHLAQARLRAIEEGLPLLRAANTGVSAIIDPYGRILGQLPLGSEGLLKGALPQAIAPPLFARAPLLAPFLAWLAVALAAFAAAVKSKFDKAESNVI